MHQSRAVAISTATSAAGFGLLAWLGAAHLLDAIPTNWWLRCFAFDLALGLIVVGYLSESAGPQGSRQATSQMHSWSDHQGTVSLVTFAVAVVFAIVVVLGVLESLSGVFAAVTLVGALIVIGFCSASKNDALSHPTHAMLAIATGGLLFCGLATLFGTVQPEVVWIVLIAVLAGWLLKVFDWARIDDRPTTSAAGAANDASADELRSYTVIALFLVPALCCVALLALPAGFAPLFGLTAALTGLAGLFAERRLSFVDT